MLLLSLLLLACAEANSPSEESPEASDLALGPDGGPNPQPQDLGPPQEAALPLQDQQPLLDRAPAPQGLELYLSAPASQLLHFGAQLPLPVEVRTLDGLAAPNVAIRGRLLEGAEERAEIGGSALVAANSRSDAQGYAELTIRGGDTARQFRVEISAEGSAPVFYQINVVEALEGRISVQLRPGPGVGDGGARIFIHAEGGCALVDPPVVMELPSVADIRGPDPSSLSEPLAGGSRLSVSAHMEREGGAISASGCLDAQEIIAGQILEVELILEAREFDLSGTFASQELFDMATLLPGGESETLEMVARIGGGNEGSRGSAIIDLLCDYAELGVASCTTLNFLGGEIIDDVIETQVPPAVVESLTIFGDLYNIARSMEVEGRFLFGGSGGQHELLALWFTWREGCPHPEEECRFRIELDEAGLGLEALPSAAFETQMEGRLLRISQHELPLPLEAVLLMMLESWLLPGSLGEGQAVSLEELSAQLLPCESISELSGDLLSVDYCEELLPSALAALLEDQVLSMIQGISSVILMGEAQMRIQSQQVELLEEGLWSGPIPGSFEAQRSPAQP